MKIVVLGATGHVGSRFLTEAVADGHEVVAFVRRPEAVPPHAGVRVVPGEAADTAALTAAATGADALLVSITGSTKDATFMQRTLPPVIRAAQQAGVRRVVLVSAFGAGGTAEKAAWFMRLAYHTVLGTFFADKDAADTVLAGTDLDWTIVYPVNLKDATAPASATVVDLDEVGAVPGVPTLPFDAAARALLQVVTDPGMIGRRVLVTTPTGWRPVR
ncbi:MAG TPA: NAD(P)-binding oxidoreductase [Cellulomonas sp.]